MLANKARSMAQRTLHSPKFTKFNGRLNPMLSAGLSGMWVEAEAPTHSEKMKESGDASGF
jgi:hypothetical protein